MKFWQKNRWVIIVFILLTTIAGISALIIYSPAHNSPQPNYQTTATPTQQADLPTTISSTPANQSHEFKPLTTSTTTTTDASTGVLRTSANETKPSANSTTDRPAPLEAKMVVGERTYRLLFYPGERLITAMERLSAMSDQPFLMTTKEYAGMGKFVTEINGVKNDTKSNHYWGYYINGQSAPTGISSYTLKQGDNIEWKYAQINL